MRWPLCLAVLCAAIWCGCRGPGCSDGVLQAGEECDDGNTFVGDGCSLFCTVEDGYTCPGGSACQSVCGDGFVTPDETCDPTAPGFVEYCSDDCATVIARCGDGTVQPAQEACDDGDPAPDDGCTDECTVAFGWTCDPDTLVCDASHVDPTKQLGELTSVEREAICSWMVAALGGEGTRHVCGATTFTVSSVAQCAATFPADGGRTCTVRELESWTARRTDACDFLRSDIPICAAP